MQIQARVQVIQVGADLTDQRVGGVADERHIECSAIAKARGRLGQTGCEYGVAACRRIDAQDLTVGGIGNVQHTVRADATAEAYRVERRQQGGSGRRRGRGRYARRSDAEGELEEAQECYSYPQSRRWRASS